MQLEDKAKAEGGASITAASVVGAIDSQTNTNKRRDLVLVGGHFVSPFASKMNESGQSSRVNQYFRLLKTYAINDSLGNGNYYYLDNVDGWLITWSASQESAVNATINLNAEASYLTAKISSQLSMGLSDKVKLSLTDFDFFLPEYNVGSGSEKSYGFQVLPTIDEVIRVLETSASYKEVDDKDMRFATPGSFQKHQQIIPGMPPSLCDKGLWQIDEDDLVLDSVVPTGGSNSVLKDCLFSITYSVPNQTNANSVIDKAYNLVYRDSAPGKALKVRAVAHIPFSNEPLVVTSAPPAIDRTSRMFSIPFRIDSEELHFILQSVRSNSGRLKCGTQELDVSLDAVQNQGGFWFISGRVPEFNGGVDSCSLTGNLDLIGVVNGNNRRYARPINGSIRFAQST